MRISSKALFALAVGLVLGLAGCKSIGPGTIARDRFEYSASISDSWKRQTLLNIVKLRYLDPPIFVDVGQIVAGYSLETGVTAAGQVGKTGAGDSFVGVGGRVVLIDRPTITYTPLTGNKFVKALTTPLPPESVFFLIQSGWPADGVLFAAAASINGLKNQETSLTGVVPPDPNFLRVLELLSKIQRSGAVSMRVLQDPQKRQTSLLTFRSAEISAETLGQIAELRRLLRLDPDTTEFNLAFGAAASNNKELAVMTRSLLHIMNTMAAQVETPAQDISQGRATPGFDSAPTNSNPQRLVRIRNSKDRPADAFVAVSYRDSWFWIDDRDLRSKRAFAFMLMLFTLAESGEKEALPLITIPAQ